MKLNESFVHYGNIDITEFLYILEQLKEEDWDGLLRVRLAKV